ncbi:MAG: DUF4132 domain-containing protein, partial [Oscillospiraceae bacterium]|nr:DUF4132 domain-containing protein [Oscillospiraceae bacterium]
MMYVNKAVPGEQFARLTEALQAYGILEDTLKIVREYLNPENPRNNALLEQIPAYDFSRTQNDYQRWDVLKKAIQKEINRLNQTELFERYILICEAIAGVYCIKLAILELPGGYEEIIKLMRNAFQTRYGNTADARVTACLATYYASWRYYYYSFRNFVREFLEDPNRNNEAVAYAQDYSAKLYLVLLALHEVNLQEKNLIFKPSAHLKKELLQHMDELAKYKWNTSEMKLYMFVAMVEASCLDEKYLQMLDLTVQNNHALIGEIATEAVRIFEKTEEHIFHRLNALSVTDPKYISFVMNNAYIAKFSGKDKLLKQIAKKFPFEFRTQIVKETNCTMAENMKKIYLSVHPDSDFSFAIQEKSQLRCMNILVQDRNFKSEVTNFLNGTLSMEEFLEILPKLQKHYFGTDFIQYTKAYGMDDFAERCICCYAFLSENQKYSMNQVLGFHIEKNEKKYIDILRKNHVPTEFILNSCAAYAMDYYTDATKTEAKDRIIKVCASYMDEVVAVDSKQLTADARCLYVQILGENGKYKYLSELFAMASDSSKNVRNVLINYLPEPTDPCNEKLLALLQAKKIAQREVAIGLLEKKFPDCWREHVQKAFEIEKNQKLQARLGTLLGAEIPEEVKQATSENLVDSLTKGNKGKKTDWLFKNAYTPVYFKNHLEVTEKYLQAIVNCYAGMSIGNYERSPQADQLAADLISTDLERFAQEVFSRWLDQGAAAKAKWVLYFTAIHGGMDAIQVIQHYIKDWSEHSRGAIAAEAVKALAYNGSSAALMQVDAMARKFKNKQVRSAANAALQQAADILGITREELADKIIPDLGFDETLCRVFDYGTRQFQVYLTPALELEIYEGEKKFKNLPKPGTKDDPEKSAQAVKDFKDMKKQMKAAIQSQKSRLEYALLCDRKWTVQGWKDLFIKKPVMHCFAIGLIWGVYENQKLIQTFRYTEDGSFNTSDSDEYTFPEDIESIRIGLVHPVELEQDALSEWIEQLEDYEITQPFAQLTRKIYRLFPEDSGKTAVQQFYGDEMGNISLAGKMLKAEWSKGDAQDGGAFYEFTRMDIASQKKSKDGKMQYTGYYVELAFEGMYIAVSFE